MGEQTKLGKLQSTLAFLDATRAFSPPCPNTKPAESEAWKEAPGKREKLSGPRRVLSAKTPGSERYSPVSMATAAAITGKDTESPPANQGKARRGRRSSGNHGSLFRPRGTEEYGDGGSAHPRPAPARPAYPALAAEWRGGGAGLWERLRGRSPGRQTFALKRNESQSLAQGRQVCKVGGINSVA
ncbi:uncharacterized protein C17orf100 homolog isoform X1 [Hylobates moloch]|uniref:uncharacterized protein C17orf100 homolog isoform X1 n=1 Tax=Hylobates moloch TaxID=81572 RepID=UPI0013626307|nr:uncharacterized protein C17orf100 homolog isoform X1 [Hylobates moloch]